MPGHRGKPKRHKAHLTAMMAAVVMINDSGCSNKHLIYQNNMDDDDLIFKVTKTLATENLKGISEHDLHQYYRQHQGYCLYSGTGKSHVECVITTLMNGLNDQRATYLTKGQCEIWKKNAQKDADIGARLFKRKDGLVEILDVYPGSPAYNSGLSAGDIILTINKENATQRYSMKHIIKELIRGKAGSDITLTIRKNNKKQNITLTRQCIKTTPLKHWVDDNILNIVVYEFNKETEKQFYQALTAAKQPFKGIIIDLRNNPGGLFQAAVNIADFLLPEGSTIINRKEKQQANKTTFRQYRSQKKDLSEASPLVVLVNKETKSAAELLAGALQSNNRATIIGTNSYGKGTVQKIIPVGGDFGAIKLTVAEYELPTGKPVEGIGIKPDLIATETAKQTLKAIDYLKGSVIIAAADLSLGIGGIKRKKIIPLPHSQ